MIQRPLHIEHYATYEDDLGKMAKYALHLEKMLESAMSFVPRRWESDVAARLGFQWEDLADQIKDG